MILVACHDAGGAELVSSFISRTGVLARAVLSGPAERIFARKLPNITRISLAEGLTCASRLICGTSWPATLECEAILAAREAGVPSVAVLDHWINYRRRFERNGVFYNPDVVWVCDELAEQIAHKELPELAVTRIENPYRLELIDQLAAMPSVESRRSLSILYVTEPTAEASLLLYGDSRHFGYTEIQALREFLIRLNDWVEVGEVVIRPHPTEPADKYSWACADSRIRIDVGAPLLMQVAYADIVVGCNSMAMVVASWLAKRVMCAIPKGGRGFSLPVDGIEFLNEVETHYEGHVKANHG